MKPSPFFIGCMIALSSAGIQAQSGDSNACAPSGGASLAERTGTTPFYRLAQFPAANALQRRCGSIAVNLSSLRVFVAAGKCDMQDSHYKAIEACNNGSRDWGGQCISGDMHPDGSPYLPELNQCGSRYAVLACKIDHHRPYCRMGCSSNSDLVGRLAMEKCRSTFGFSRRPCVLNGVDGTERPWDLDSL